MLWDVLGICRLCAGDLGHSRSVSRRVRSFFFQLELIMSISSDGVGAGSSLEAAKINNSFIVRSDLSRCGFKINHGKSNW